MRSGLGGSHYGLNVNYPPSTNDMTQAQGFHFSKAVGADQAGEFLRQGRMAAAGKSSTEEHAAGIKADPERV